METQELSASPERAPRRGPGKLLVILGGGLLCLAAGLLVSRAVHTIARSIHLTAAPAERPAINAPYIQTPDPVVEKMVDLARLEQQDVVYDLGCGDGRIVIAAVRRAGCRGVGIDIDPERIEEARENAGRQGVAERVEFRRQDVFEVDLSEADAALIYLNGWMVDKLQPQLERMPAGARIVSHDFWLEQVRPDAVVEVTIERVGMERHSLYVYTTPLRRDPAMERGRPPQPREPAGDG